MSLGFPCPVCRGFTGRVKDSRPNLLGIRRRRECSKGHRYSTQERLIDPEEQTLAKRDRGARCTATKIFGDLHRREVGS